jgi:acylphosphatase
MVCIRCKVSGRVQGVFFRASTQREARSLEITGYAKNLPDGSVEVLACGSASAVEQLGGWLWIGPPAAGVSHVDCAPIKVDVPDEFTIS